MTAAAALSLRRGLAGVAGGLCRARAQVVSRRGVALRRLTTSSTEVHPRVALTNPTTKCTLSRQFSTTATPLRQVEGPLPHFPPTSNQNLDHLLSLLHSELFVPPHLLSRHRNLIYRHKNHPLLLEEPIYYTVSNQAIQLVPKTNIPSLPRSLFTKCINSMQVPRDYDVVPGLLLGFTQAGRPLLPQHFEKFARSAALAGRSDVVLQALDGAELNHFKANKQLARDTIYGIFVQNQQSTFNAATKALKRAIRLQKLLENPKVVDLGTCHNPETIPEVTTKEWAIERKKKLKEFLEDPVIVGTTAGMFASTSLRFAPSGVDHALQTAEWVMKTFKAWGNLEKEVQLIDTIVDTESARHRLDPENTGSVSAKDRKAFEVTYNTVKDALVGYKFIIHALKDSAKVFKHTLDAVTLGATTSGAQDEDLQRQLASIYSTTPLRLPKDGATPPSHGAIPQEKADLVKFAREAAPRLVLEISRLEQMAEKWEDWVRGNDPFKVKKVVNGEVKKIEEVTVQRLLGVDTYLEAAERLEEFVRREKEGQQESQEQAEEKEGELQDEVAWA